MRSEGSVVLVAAHAGSLLGRSRAADAPLYKRCCLLDFLSTSPCRLGSALCSLALPGLGDFNSVKYLLPQTSAAASFSVLAG